MDNRAVDSMQQLIPAKFHARENGRTMGADFLEKRVANQREM